MNIKKCLKGIVAGACVMLSSAFVLTGCGTDDPEEPEVVINNPTGYTYYWDGQRAYKNQDVLPTGSYIIATPENAQTILDKGDEKEHKISGKVVIFTEGVYETLYIRPGDNDETREFETGKFVREIENVIFAGTEGAKFTDDIVCDVKGTNHLKADGIEFTEMKV